MKTLVSHVRRAAAPKGVAALLIGLGVLFVAVAASTTDGTRLAVRGRVTDEGGEGVPGQTVRLLKSRTYLRLGGLRSLDQSVEETRAVTDSLGFFEFDFPLDASFPYFYLRFYDPKTFDAVKYRLPEDREITKRVRKGRPVQASATLRYQPDWPQIKALIDSYSPGSQVGQVLRSLGLPTSRTPEGSGREVWSYQRAGVAYLIDGGRVIETRAVPGGARSAEDEPSGDDPAPAVRVDEP